MKKALLVLGIVLSFITPSNGQMTVEHTFLFADTGRIYESQVVDLSLSGKKFAILRTQNFSPPAPDTIFYYNLDYSFWKMIPCPVIPFGSGRFNLNFGYVCYSSETLFNLDTLLEVAVSYGNTSNIYNLYIINENGVLTDSITHVASPAGPENAHFIVHEISPTRFIATVSHSSGGVSIINLPGTIPCNACGGGLGLAKTPEKPKDMLSAPVPNPSNEQTKITFTLPDDAKFGELTIYNTNGKKMKSYTVDNRFGYIMVDNNQFPSGIYYYNLVANGEVSTIQKMVVIK